MKHLTRYQNNFGIEINVTLSECPVSGGELPGMAPSILRRKSSHSSQRPLASASLHHGLSSRQGHQPSIDFRGKAVLKRQPLRPAGFDLTGQTSTIKIN
jgi:hypothetical protein